MSNDSITIDNDNTNFDKYVILTTLTPQNFLFQMNKSYKLNKSYKPLLNSSANQIGKEKCNSNISGVVLFGFDLGCLEKKWDQLKNSNNSLLMNQQKPLKELSPLQIN
ncbi:9102_t:CDS:2 [Gigaspora margarita]|uniref:9102_t:CDS:1 n=1 Tax=Gigaspora margarita TaxID=4874 RepID=A0ABN7VKC7_GIGMA|nr:9102_t:CDS:2 [Gigaspora margarita]